MGNYLEAQFSSKEEYEQAFVKRDSYKNSFFGGSKGLGDPDDKFLYKYEKKFNLPIKRKQIIFEEYCSKPHEVYLNCRRAHRFLHKFHCKDEFVARKQCLRKFWDSPGIEERAHNEYLAARSHYRRTGQTLVKESFLDSMFTFQPKSWEDYQSDKDMGFWLALKKSMSTIFGNKNPSDGRDNQVDVSVPDHSN